MLVSTVYRRQSSLQLRPGQVQRIVVDVLFPSVQSLKENADLTKVAEVDDQ